jgi:alanine racemase
MSLKASVALVKQVPGGHGVSYGHHYVTPGVTTLGLIPVGYADGIPRHASGTGPVLVGGKWRTVAGRVAMDQFVVDLGGDELEAGAEAILFGAGDHGEPTAEDWAQAAGTIAYEIVTRIGTRVPRVYVNEVVGEGGPGVGPEVVPEIIPGYEGDDVAQGSDVKRSGT